MPASVQILLKLFDAAKCIPVLCVHFILFSASFHSLLSHAHFFFESSYKFHYYYYHDFDAKRNAAASDGERERAKEGERCRASATENGVFPPSVLNIILESLATAAVLLYICRVQSTVHSCCVFMEIYAKIKALGHVVILLNIFNNSIWPGRCVRSDDDDVDSDEKQTQDNDDGKDEDDNSVVGDGNVREKSIVGRKRKSSAIRFPS